MQRLLILLGILAAAGLLVWQFTGEQARRVEREDRPAIEPLPQDDEISITVETAELRGIVKGERGAPLAGALIEVPGSEDEPPVRAESGPDGWFRVDGSEGPWARLRISHPDYVAVETWARVEFDNEFELERGAPFTVLVLDPAGEPVPRAVVKAGRVDVQGVPGIWSWSDEHELGAEKTGDDGRVSLGAMPDTPFQLVVTHPKFARFVGELELREFKPVEHVVRLNQGGSVEGTVFGPDGEPLGGAVVRAGQREATSDAGGRYRVDRVEIGFVTVSASARDLAPGFFGQRLGWDDPVPVQILGGETTTGLDIHLGNATWVSGCITDGHGKPIPEANLNVRVWGGYSLQEDFRSGSDGRFKAGPFAVFRRADARVYARADGFQYRNSGPRPVGPGESVDIGTLKLTRSAVVRGRCLDSEGKPVPGARVTVIPMFNSVRAGEDGSFELPDVPTGKVSIAAERRELASGRVVLDIVPGRDVEDLELTLQALLSIRGRVTTPAGAARQDIVMLARELDLPDQLRRYVTYGCVTDEEGRYVLESLPPGRFEVGIVGFGRGSIGWNSTYLGEPRTAKSGDSEVDFEYPFTGGIVTAKVVSRKSGLPVRKFNYASIRYRAFLPSVDDVATTEDDDGRFRFEFKNEGTWALEFSAAGHAPYNTGKLKLKRGEKRDLGTIRLGEGGVIEGRVVDAQGAPVPYTRINILSPKFETNEDEPFTGRDGRFRVPGVSPGIYMVFAISPRHPIGIVKNILVREAKTTQAEVRFAESAPLEIIVRGEDGQPLKGAELYWSFPEIAPLTSKMVGDKIPPGYGDNESDDGGRIFQDSLPAGAVTLFVEANGFTPVSRLVQLKAGKRTRIEILLAPKK